MQLIKDLAKYILEINTIESEYLKLENISSTYNEYVLIPIKSSSVDTLSSWSEISEDIEPHERFQYDMDNELKEKVYHLFRELIDSIDVPIEDLKNYIDCKLTEVEKLGEYKESEYYGNFSNYFVYKVDVKSLLANVSNQEIAQMYCDSVKAIILEQKPKMKM